MDLFKMKCATDESANDVVASIMSLTVQHCPAASSNPKDLCSILQVSTACRTALRTARGSCIATIKGSAHKLTEYAAWLDQHDALVQELHVDVSTRVWKDPEDQDPIITPHAAVGAALPKLSKLKSFSLCGGDQMLTHSVLGPLQTFSMLTRLHVRDASPSVLGALPPSVQDLKLLLRADWFVKLAAKKGTPYVCKPLDSFTALQALAINVYDPVNPSFMDPVPQTTVGLALSVPPSLTSLSVSGPISYLAYPAGLPLLQSFTASTGISMPPEALTLHVSRMPRLREVHIDGLRRTEYDVDDTLLSWPQARGLAAVLAAATNLTTLSLDAFAVEWDGMDVQWGRVLQQLTGLKSLTLGVGPSDVDVLPLANLHQLTSLTLGGGSPISGGNSLSEEPLSMLLVSLTCLQELTIRDSGALRSCAVLFGAITQLTDLRKLGLFHNGDLVCELEAFVQLTQLTNLTELDLSHATSETVTEGDAAAFRELMPQLVRFSCCTKSNPAPLIIASNWDEMNDEVVVDQMDIEE